MALRGFRHEKFVKGSRLPHIPVLNHLFVEALHPQVPPPKENHNSHIKPVAQTSQSVGENRALPGKAFSREHGNTGCRAFDRIGGCRYQISGRPEVRVG